ncbi:MAG: hypothetical protein LBT50_04900 [Prevotellaceae bacterium]|jgi:hypothetical protein|nr:hypothetical protein [Prevotellaceae bacterium]
MKKYIYVFLFLGIVGFTACEDKDNDVVVTPPTEAQKQLAAITAKLETLEGINKTFIENLRKIDLRNSNEKSFTVFAVKDQSSKLTPAASGEITRQMVKGAYSKAELTDGLTLTTVKGDKLSVKVIDNNVFVDGVAIATDSVTADQSAIFVVSGYFPTTAPKMVTFKVQSCKAKTPKADTLQYVDAPGAEITFYVNDTVSTETFVTGADGTVSFLIDTLEYTYLVSKEDEKNITSEGYQIAGIFTSQSELDSIEQDGKRIGGLRFADLNNDKIIDEKDKTAKAKFTVADTVVAYIAKP